MKSFEEKLEQLESINEKINSGDVPLEEAIGLFDQGIRLAKDLEKTLSKVERKIEILVNQPESPDENPDLELFRDLAETTYSEDDGG